MSLHERQDITGRLTLRLHAPDGRVAREQTASNEITPQGRALVAQLFNRDMAATPIARVSQIGLGRNGEKLKAGGTTLNEPIGMTPVRSIEQVPRQPNETRTVLRLTGELAEKEMNGVLQEAGLFTEDGVMYNRVTFAPISKSEQFKLTLVWEITF
ncbi:MAG TPA: hypothetical protein VFQ45_17865 [Longimicrobium sp.]|nr:hypothetical protein [Longimicrobium sp.]